MLPFRFLVAAAGFVAAIAAQSAPAVPPAGLATATRSPSLVPHRMCSQDTASGQAIVEENADERRDPASLTKLMTAYVVFAALRDEDDHGVADGHGLGGGVEAPKARGCSSSRARRYRSTSLLRGMIVQSGNDASIALAEQVAGNEDGVRRADERRSATARASPTRTSSMRRACRTRSTIRARAISRCSLRR